MLKHSNWRRVSLSLLLVICGAITATSQTFQKIFTFNGTNGESPLAMSLTQGTDGGLYGTTVGGGLYGSGTIFRISQAGLRTLFNFNASPGTGPATSLIQANDGEYYGTSSGDGPNNWGTVFKITARGNLTTLYSFCASGTCTDGMEPHASLLQASDGNFYGSTMEGGDLTCQAGFGCGLLFKITPQGDFTIVHVFEGIDGRTLATPLIQADDGNIYGATLQGGTYDFGTIFKLTLSGQLTTLHSFNYSDGYAPTSLIQALDGDLYGVTANGGAYAGGAFFKLSLGRGLALLHSFNSDEGQSPAPGLIQATDGNFYGTTQVGGQNLAGTVFQLTASGAITTLHNFAVVDGTNPSGGLMQDTNGLFYGGTVFGGAKNDGTLFSLDTGLKPFVKLARNSGRSGSAQTILGQGFMSATAVFFNGTAAAFTVISDSFLKATVPPGATTGYVTVTTSTGTLTSNRLFRVIP